MSFADFGPKGSKSIGDVAELAIAARHPTAQGEQYLGNTGHAYAADSTKWALVPDRLRVKSVMVGKATTNGHHTRRCSGGDEIGRLVDEASKRGVACVGACRSSGRCDAVWSWHAGAGARSRSSRCQDRRQWWGPLWSEIANRCGDAAGWICRRKASTVYAARR